jgi:biopolymer transport protein ExbD
MIDIMSVMVAFLLVYSADVEVVQNGKGVQVPQSVAPEEAKQSVVVMLTRDELFVQGERVASVSEIRAAKDPLIEPLSAVLTRPLLESETTPEALADREITLIADKSLPYEVVKRVMSTCTREGYGHISLAVIEKESSQI